MRCSAIAQDEIESAESESVHKGPLLQGRYPSQCDSIPLNHVCRSRSDIATAASPLCRRNSSPCAGLEPAANLTSVYNTDPRLAKFLKNLTIQGSSNSGVIQTYSQLTIGYKWGLSWHSLDQLSCQISSNVWNKKSSIPRIYCCSDTPPEHLHASFIHSGLRRLSHPQ